jgi:hypothetical protein
MLLWLYERCSQEGVYDQVYLFDITRINLFLYELRGKVSKTTTKEQAIVMFKYQHDSYFALHYMHLVLLGVFKRLLTIGTGECSKKNFKHKIGIPRKK